MRLLYQGMVLAVLVSITSLILYTLVLQIVTPATPRPRVSKADYQTITGTEIESHFSSLETHNCSSGTTREVNTTWSNSVWQRVEGSRVYLYRSYYDVRYTYGGASYHYVRVLGMSQGKVREQELYCNLWYPRESTPVAMKADVTEIWQPLWDSRPKPDMYHSYLLSCPVPARVQERRMYPESVSVSRRPCGDMTTLLKVHHDGIKAWQRSERRGRYAVCVKGMNFEEDVSVRLVEWLEMMFILGASKVMTYKYFVHPNVSRVLDHYNKKGKVVTIPLTLPGTQPNDPRQRTRYLKRAMWQKRRNELVPYNDCLYRNIYLYEYVVPLDIDEVIVPIREHTWPQMFEGLTKTQPKAMERHASFSAQNAYFFDVFNATSSDPDIPTHLHMLRHTTRSANFSIPGHSVKSFISTKNSLTVFNHYTLQPLYPRLKRYLVLNTTTAQINHYKRRCPREMYSQCTAKFLVFTKKDEVIMKYKDKLTRRVDAVLRELNLLV